MARNIIILFYYHHVYIIICLLHGEELYNNLLISNCKFSVNFFFHRSSTVILQYVHPWHKKALFIKQQWSSTITEESQTTAVSKTGKKTVEYAFFILTSGQHNNKTCWPPASRGFLLLITWFWCTRERLCMNWVSFLWTMHCTLLGYSFWTQG